MKSFKTPPLVGFFQGIRCFKEGMFLVFKNKSLWKYIAAPVLIQFIVLSLIFGFGGYYIFDNALPEIHFKDIDQNLSFWKQIWMGIKNYTGVILIFLLDVLVFIIGVIVYIVLFFFLITITGSPFYDALSEKIENMRQSYNEQKKSISKLILYPIGNAVKMMILQLLLFVIVFPLSFIPVVGQVLFLIFSIWMCTANLMCYCVERRFWGVRQLMTFSVKHCFAFIGLGLPSFFLIAVPFLNALTVPLTVAGATLLFIELNGLDVSVK